MVRMTIAMGIEPITAIQMATINGAEALWIGQKVGSIAPGRAADILLVKSLEDFRVSAVVAKGRLAARDGRLIEDLAPPKRSAALTNTIGVEPIMAEDLAVRHDRANGEARVFTIAVTPEQIFVRKRRDATLPIHDGLVQADVGQDVQYLTVVERYGKTRHRPVAFVSGFGLRSGALATSTAPDDNNIVCVGTNPEDMAVAVNQIIVNNGGQVVVDGGNVVSFLPLPIGGIVSDLDPTEMARKEQELDHAAKSLGCNLPWPFMYMFVLQITAIPDFAMTDLGAIDCIRLEVVDPLQLAS